MLQQLPGAWLCYPSKNPAQAAVRPIGIAVNREERSDAVWHLTRRGGGGQGDAIEAVKPGASESDNGLGGDEVTYSVR